MQKYLLSCYGTIGWLPDFDKWAKIVSTFLKPNGKFIFVGFHPVVWMFDDHFRQIVYNYFNAEPIIETSTGTYADKDAPITQQDVMWNHGLSEVMNRLIQNGLEINSFEEFDYSPYNCFNHDETVEVGIKKYRIKKFDNKIPMVYAIAAT